MEDTSLCSIVQLQFPYFSIFSFLLQLQISSSVSQIIKELCSSNLYPFHFRHLSFNSIVKKAISSHNMTNLIDFSTQDITYLEDPTICNSNYRLKHRQRLRFMSSTGHFYIDRPWTSIGLQHHSTYEITTPISEEGCHTPNTDQINEALQQLVTTANTNNRVFSFCLATCLYIRQGATPQPSTKTKVFM